jgi:hypothetical protein
VFHPPLSFHTKTVISVTLWRKNRRRKRPNPGQYSLSVFPCLQLLFAVAATANRTAGRRRTSWWWQSQLADGRLAKRHSQSAGTRASYHWRDRGRWRRRRRRRDKSGRTTCSYHTRELSCCELNKASIVELTRVSARSLCWSGQRRGSTRSHLCSQ